MKLCDDKKQCITYRAIHKTHFTKANFEDLESSHRVFLQQMCMNLALSTDLLTSFDDFLNGKLV